MSTSSTRRFEREKLSPGPPGAISSMTGGRWHASSSSAIPDGYKIEVIQKGRTVSVKA